MGAKRPLVHESPIAWKIPSNYKTVPNTRDAPSTRPKSGAKDQPSPSAPATADLPTLGGHERNEDGSLTGFVFGSKIYRDGESIVTSAVVQALDDQVVTESGSRYLLGVAAPQLPAPPSGPTTIAVVGSGDCGQLGFGPDLLEAEKPKRCPFFEGKRIVSIACGGMHTAAVGVDGLVWTWGCNDDGALGRTGDEDVPQLATGGALAAARVTAVTCGDSVSVALLREGGVASWGTYRDAGGLLGFSPAVDVQREPLLLDKLPTVRLVVCGANHTLAVTMRGTLYAWGCAEQAVLGCRLGAARPKAKLLPTHPLALRRGRASLPVVSAAAGAYHSLALTADGEVWAWGLNNHGQLGCGGFASASAPHAVAALRGLRVEQLDAGEHHSLARTAAGEVYGWGRADSSQLGLGSGAEATVARDIPVRVPGVSDVRSIACGSNHCCAVTAEADLFTWGFGEMSQLGHGEADDEPSPRLVSAVRGRVAQAGAGGQHTVMLLKPKE